MIHNKWFIHYCFWVYSIPEYDIQHSIYNTIHDAYFYNPFNSFFHVHFSNICQHYIITSCYSLWSVFRPVHFYFVELQFQLIVADESNQIFKFSFFSVSSLYCSPLLFSIAFIVHARFLYLSVFTFSPRSFSWLLT